MKDIYQDIDNIYFLFYKVYLSYDAQNGIAVEDTLNKTRHKGSGSALGACFQIIRQRTKSSAQKEYSAINKSYHGAAAQAGHC